MVTQLLILDEMPWSEDGPPFHQSPDLPAACSELQNPHLGGPP